MISLACLLALRHIQSPIPPIIPKPQVETVGQGAPFEITRGTHIVGSSRLFAIQTLQTMLGNAAGFRLRVGNPSGSDAISLNGSAFRDIPVMSLAGWNRAASNTIEFIRDTSGAIANEGYTLHADSNGIQITYATPAGALYGVETLRQLLPPQIEDAKPNPDTHWTVPAVDISDQPRFGWRGMMLDVSRHFFPVSFIKKYLDFLAMEKMNVFHWHLVDDGGWRIQIDKYPNLTKIGSTRYGVTTGWDQGKLSFDPKAGAAYGGFYTKKEVRDVIKYAAERNITIVPEIEMPGHSMPVFAAYPNLGCLNQPASSVMGQPDTNVYCAGNPETYKFVEDVLTEVMDLFPSPYIHIGGDEVDKEFWHRCPRCQALMKDKGLKNEEELQSYFIKTIEAFVASKGRHLIGWDEILEGGLAPGAAVMSWRGEDGGIAAAQADHDVVMSPTTYVYFDYAYEGQSTQHVYSWNPVPSALNADQAKHVLGGQANEWCEWIPTEQRAEFMIFPRILALSEVLWSPQASRDWADFSGRLDDFYTRLDRQGITYHIEAPVLADTAVIFSGSTQVSVGAAQAPIGTLRYTTDGSVPSGTSPAYTGPITVTGNEDIHFAYVGGAGQAGEVSTISCRRAEPIEVKTITPGWRASYYEGEWNKVPDFSTIKPAWTGTAQNISIDPKKRDENYALRFEGMFLAQEDGAYTFSLSSDDGSWMKLSGATVVDNDGPHANEPKTGRVRLSKGWHTIEVGYYQGGGAEALSLEVKAPGSSEFVPIDRLVAQPQG